MQNEYYRDLFNRVQVDRTILNNAESFEEHTKRLGMVDSRHISLGLDVMPIVCGDLQGDHVPGDIPRTQQEFERMIHRGVLISELLSLYRLRERCRWFCFPQCTV